MPEQQTQDHRSLLTSITNQKAALETFKPDKTIAEKQSDKFNIYEDSVEGIMSEKTHMRLEIARLQHEVECMKISRGKTSVIMKVLEEFRSQSETDDILEDNDLDENAIMNMQHFWKECNL
ncbi:hypothetical protein BDDG_13197 [Blastomyces dermatitidis ATCC 18188]|uniref:Uncharacterized protein n=1 Tax=Ajellomyces dermatitidis (strain ATCC 18188 / CBS 674.68) TaxID=653446 RepID=A0A0J9ERR3_AJEDA|nr:hypothetical protein BDDG_13197 [Blastomyces dermatitidis ATCC 18188]